MSTFSANKGIGCIALALGVSIAAMAATPATADDWGYRHHRHDSGSFSFGLTAPGYYYDSPGYYYNPPAYEYAPPPAPRYYYPPPTYYAPPPSYYYDTEPSFDFGLSFGSHR